MKFIMNLEFIGWIFNSKSDTIGDLGNLKKIKNQFGCMERKMENTEEEKRKQLINLGLYGKLYRHSLEILQV